MHSMKGLRMHGLIACLACFYIGLQGTQAATSCIDVVPPGNYTCAEQKAYGKCTSPWMVKGKFCEATCGACSPAPAISFAAPTGEPSKSTPPPSTTPSPPKSETQAALLAAANSLSSPTSRPNTVVALPDLSLPNNINVPSPPLGYVPPPPLASSAPGTTTSSIIANVYSVPSPVPRPQEPAGSTPAGPLASTPGMETVPQAPQTVATKSGCNATTAWDVLSNDPELSIFTQAAAALNLTGVLKDANINFTIFAPVDAAWVSLAKEENTTPSGLLTNLVVLRQLMFSNIVPNAIINAEVLKVLPSITPETKTPIFVAASPGVPISLISPGSTAQVTTPNSFVGCNYVIHKTNAVLESSPVGVSGVNPEYQSALSTGRAAGR